MTDDQPAAPPPSAPKRPRSMTRMFQRATLIWLACAVAYAIVGLFARFYDRFPGDEAITTAFQRVDVPALGGYLAFVNSLGDRWLHLALVVGAVLLLSFWRAGWEALLVLYALVPSFLAGFVKDWVARPRPSEELVAVTDSASGFSFPSGHVMSTASLFLVLFFVVPVVVRQRLLCIVLQGGCALLIVSAGPARVYPGVHWTSDVIAGYALVALLVVPPLLAYLRLRPSETARS